MRKEIEIFNAHLHKVGLKRTAQREAILQTFLRTPHHLTTNDLFRLVHRENPRIGFTTVYRTLKLLTECGLAWEVDFGDGRARYEHQYNRQHHDHMLCTRCGRSVEFYEPAIRRLQEDILRKHHFVGTGHRFQIFGICQQCRKRATSRRS